MTHTLTNARTFLLTHARLLERRLFEVRFEGGQPASVGNAVRAYQNADGGLGHALEPDIRAPESQPLFTSFGLGAMEEAGCRDAAFALSVCDYLQSVSDENGLVPLFSESALQAPVANHWKHVTPTPGLNPTADLCGSLHDQGIEHEWLARATETCFRLIMEEPPLEAHTLLCATKLAAYIPDQERSANLMDTISIALPRARFFKADALSDAYGLTPLHFARQPDSVCSPLFTQSQIDRHLEVLLREQLPDGGWPIGWEAPGPAAELEWRGVATLEAISRLSAYGVI
ncbi:hypothetical protein [Paenibacillus methanolicus]|uniref:Uncharacterized protein n=1 Tax=Paenibacillus methanolicus TaxID=582686 RepID=A0A5S5C7G7_9BACL|nr:hypothetical protein [Paenibacillus methanolicus]TYP74548.1 hypothetical protein BCM02_10592 [Paenibacillus methanolicus]